MASLFRPPALILAGGRSRRMGSDKTRATLGGRPLILHVVERLKSQASAIAIAGPPALAGMTGLPAVKDAHPDFAGPLSGLLGGLRYARQAFAPHTHLLTAPADTPFLPLDLAARLSEKAGSRPVVACFAGRTHPVCALWPLALAETLDGWLMETRKASVMAFIGQTGFETVDFTPAEASPADFDPFHNVNTPEELETARLWLEAGRF